MLESLRKYSATTPTTDGFARGGCGLFRRSETDCGENILTEYM